MALVEVSFMSKSLLRTVTLTAIIPVDKISNEGNINKITKFKTLYLLHGAFGHHLDYISGTRIQRWAEEHNLAVIMPSGENQFYIDKLDRNELYGKFIADELVTFTRNLFPLSDKKQDTFIAGLSMGGYGALINGLTYNNTFGYIGAFSPALLNDELASEDPSKIAGGVWKTAFYESVFGDLETIKSGDKDYKFLIDRLLEEKAQIPNIYMPIGTEDYLLEATRDYYQFLQKKNVPVTYIEDKGGHDWDFWDKYLKHFLEWLPLDEKESGLNSGNVPLD